MVDPMRANEQAENGHKPSVHLNDGRSHVGRCVRASIIRDRCDLSILPPAPKAGLFLAFLRSESECQASEPQKS